MPRNNQSFTKRRIKILRNIVLVALAIITVRLFVIQIIDHDHWVAKADEEHTILETISAKRGGIYMVDHNEPVAVVLNQTMYEIIIDPATVDREKTKQALEENAKDFLVVNLDEIFNQEGLRYSIVAKNVPRENIEKLAEQNFSSVWFKKANQRVYPEGELGSTLLGFVNADGLGQYGVEGSLNEQLAGKDGLLKSTADFNKVALSIGDDNIKIPAENGKNIVLSVDRSLERGTEELLQKHIDQTPATNAAALIMDPNTSEVIAMTSLPGYNPADYGKVKDASIYINQVTEVPYEPASVCKSFAFSAAINEGKMTADTTYYNQGYEIVDEWKINNAEQRSSLNGTIDMRTALYWSLNTGSIYALKLLGDNPGAINQTGRERLYDYYHNKFRLGQATGIELIEAEGFIPDPNEGWGRDSAYANITFGQNLGITMIQTATAYSSVINGGTWRTPTIVKGELDNEEIKPLQINEKVEDKILKDETSAMMRDMFVNNRSYKAKNGIDKPGYAIGGKSGTAQVIKDGAYDDTMKETVGTYIGFVGPNGDLPKYVIMVKMWAEGQYLDGQIASNLFDELSNYLINYYKIKPGN